MTEIQQEILETIPLEKGIDHLTSLQQKILFALLENGASTRNQIVTTLNTPRTTIYDNLVKLKKKDIVKKFSKNNHKQGRPKVYWQLIRES